MQALNLDIDKHTIVFDRGNNSKENMKLIQEANLSYVGALTPYHHKALVEDAIKSLNKTAVDGDSLQVYRDKREIWGEERTVVIYISENLKTGQLRGIYKTLDKIEQTLSELQKKLTQQKEKLKDRKELEIKVTALVNKQFMKDLINWEIIEDANKKLQLTFSINTEKLNELEERIGLRMLMTNRHDWSTAEIIQAYHGQAKIENAFKNIKNPYHMAVRPQFHWTDQKIKVHYFICVLGYLMTTLIWRQVKKHTNFNGTLDTLLDALNNIRLATILETKKGRGKIKAIYKLEEMSPEESQIMSALNLEEMHNLRPKLEGVGVYT